MTMKPQHPARKPQQPQQPLRVHIRWMIRRDMSDVLDIENASFLNPWTDDDFIKCLRNRNCIGMVAEHDDRVVGFMIYELHQHKLYLLNFAVRPDFRRRTVGRQLVDKLISELRPDQQHRHAISLEVRDGNLPAQLFFSAAGFRAIQVLRHHYQDTDDDAYRFWLSIVNQPPEPTGLFEMPDTLTQQRSH